MSKWEQLDLLSHSRLTTTTTTKPKTLLAFAAPTATKHEIIEIGVKFQVAHSFVVL